MRVVYLTVGFLSLHAIPSLGASRVLASDSRGCFHAKTLANYIPTHYILDATRDTKIFNAQPTSFQKQRLSGSSLRQRAPSLTITTPDTEITRLLRLQQENLKKLQHTETLRLQFHAENVKNMQDIEARLKLLDPLGKILLHTHLHIAAPLTHPEEPLEVSPLTAE